MPSPRHRRLARRPRRRRPGRATQLQPPGRGHRRRRRPRAGEPIATGAHHGARPPGGVLAEPQNAQTVAAGRAHPHRPRAGIPELHIVVDAHERYPYTFADKPAKTTREALPCGDYGLKVAGQLVAAVERKALADLTSGVLNGNLKYQLTELAALPRAAVVVEDRYSEIFAHSFARPTAIADGLAELQIGFPNVPIVFCQTRKLAQEYTYRYLAAALTWFVDDADATTVFEPAAAEPEPSSAELRAWAKSVGLPVSDRGRLRPQILQAWRAAHPR